MSFGAKTLAFDLPGTRERSKRNPSSPALLGGLLLIAAGCSTEGTTNDTSDGEGPLFIAVSTVFNNDDALSYVTPLATLEADQEVDYTRSLEKGAIPRLYADAPPRSRFFLGAGQEPTIESYQVGDGLRAGERLSLLALGVQSFDNAGFILSEDKAYYYDYATSQVIVWNPSTMEVRKTIDVSAVEREGLTAYFAYSNPGLAEGKYLFFNLQYYTGEPDYFPAEGSVLVVVNTETDELENIDVDDRCDAIANWVRTDDGTVWFATGMAAIQNAYFDLGLKTDCLLKLASDGRGFDKTYVGDLKALIESPIVGTMVKAGPNAVYVKALDEALLKLEDAAEVSDLFTNVYRFWRIDLTTMTATRDEVLPPTGSGGYFFDVDGATYADQSADDFSETTLWHMNASGGPARAVTLRGYVYGLGRVR